MAGILVTGATGFIGGNVARALAAAGHRVLATGRDPVRLAAVAAASGAAVPADLACDRLEPLVTGCEVVVHCAALSSPWGERAMFERANVLATERLLAAASAQGVRRFVHFSSPSIYFRLADQRNIPERFVPPRRWINAYAQTKWASELRVRDAHHASMTRVILRPRAVFGEGDRAIFPRILRLAERGWFPYVGGGHAQIDVTHIANVVDAVQAAIELPHTHEAQVFNISNGEPMAVRELLARLFDAAGMTVRPVYLPRTAALVLGAMAEAAARLRPGSPEPRLTRYGVGVLGYSQTLDISKAQRVLGYRPRVSVDEGIRRFAHWWRTHDTA